MTVIFSYHSFSNRNAMLAVATEVDPLVDGNAPVVRINTADIIDIGVINIPAELPPNWQPDDVVPAPRVLDGYWLCAAWRGGIPDAFLASAKPRPEQAPSFGQSLGEDYMNVQNDESSLFVQTPPPVPNIVTNLQMRMALMAMPGLKLYTYPDETMFTIVDNYIQANKTTKSGMIVWQAWEYSNNISRYGAVALNMLEQIEISNEQLDDIFIRAAKISM